MQMKMSKKQERFKDGAVRDSSEGKRKWSLVSPFLIKIIYGKESLFSLVADYQITKDITYLRQIFSYLEGTTITLEDMIYWLEQGAKKYEERNWEKGMPFSRCIDSLYRHIEAYVKYKKDEDHIAAIKCNTMFLIHYEEAIKNGVLDAKWDDLPLYTIKQNAIYIAGPMRNYYNHNREAFMEAEEYLKGQGWDNIINPVTLNEDLDERLKGKENLSVSLRQYAKRDTNAILGKCTAIYLLDGWEKSTGALMEKAIADFIKLDVYYEKETYDAMRTASP